MALNLIADDIEKSLNIEKVKEDAKKRMLSGKSNPRTALTQGSEDNDSEKGRTAQIIAKKIGVGTTTYKQGKNVHDNGIPELTSMMRI
ncbi:MAG: hypothetical protein PHG06_12415 [Parabacteroides sp.]|nr:hypothetical protein [Parabacteroides sp.]